MSPCCLPLCTGNRAPGALYCEIHKNIMNMPNRRRQQQLEEHNPNPGPPAPAIPADSRLQSAGLTLAGGPSQVTPPGPLMPTRAESEQLTTTTGAVGEAIDEWQSKVTDLNNRIGAETKEKARRQRREEQRQIQEQVVQLQDKKRKFQEWCRQQEQEIANQRTQCEQDVEKQLADIAACKKTAADQSAEAAKLLAGAQRAEDAVAARQAAAAQLAYGADLKLFSAKRQVAQMLLWAGTLGYAVWATHFAR